MTTETETPLTFECDIHLDRRGKGGRKEVREGKGPKPPAPPGRVPRVARLMALAVRFERLLREGVVKDYAEIARLGGVTRARLTQVMNLLLLAPDIQEQLLFLPRVERGRDPVILAQLQPIAAVLDWRKQRRMWEEFEKVRSVDIVEM
ncbi:MAG TPA: hypothetical protein VIL46_08230 [Gemmataceae bacterium]